MQASYLFIYGTLLIADNEFAKYLQNNSTFFAKGQFKGILYDAGDYPVAITNNNDGFYVKGSVVELTNPEETLKYIDPYEGYGIGQSQPYLYLRELLNIETENGIVQCWVYIYNRTTENFHRIDSGDYIGYLENKKSL